MNEKCYKVDGMNKGLISEIELQEFDSLLFFKLVRNLQCFPGFFLFFEQHFRHVKNSLHLFHTGPLPLFKPRDGFGCFGCHSTDFE